MKQKVLISFSGGETSAFMSQWLWRHKQDEYEMIFVFANTGQENEETLRFVEHCSRYFKFPVVWVEANVTFADRIGTTHKIVDYFSASRDGQPFEDIISKYGIPNMAMPHCTRELKQNPIKSYAKSLGWKDYYTAIGIRIDEGSRMNEKWIEKKFMYPLISKEFMPMTKPAINFFWKNMPFRLNLKGYQGNCVTCWKKGHPKLYQIARENEAAFNFFGKMELRYDKFTPESRVKKMAERGEIPIYPIRFFRGNKSVQDIIEESKTNLKPIIDDAMVFPEPNLFEDYDLQGGESCEVFSECPNDEN